MQPFHIVEGVAAPLAMAPVDTGVILPARFLRRPRHEGYQDFLFHDLRFDEHGQERPDFVLNQPAWRQACILVADRHFGVGSSREQAPWGLLDFGIRCVIAADFGDIFFLNAVKSGLLPVVLTEATCTRLREALTAQPGTSLRIDLPAQTVVAPDGEVHRFEIDAFRKHCLLEGLDDIGVTLQHDSALRAFEQTYRQRFDWLFSPVDPTSDTQNSQES
jgi:3-isopropylmalate/(R)-2-methylmalate dehydratase small subunit